MVRKPKLLAVGVLAAVGCAAVGIAYAGIPGSGGVISSCYNAGSNPSGQLRVIDADNGAKCAKNEKSLNFNQIGPIGPKGDKGDQGIQGLQGIQGIQGDQGIQGVKGDPGTSGVAAAYTNYGGALQDIGEGLTQTVSSVTLPVGSYTLMGTPYVISGGSDTRFGSCFFAPAAPYTNSTGALAYVANGNPARLVVLGDATVTSGSLVVTLRCTGLDGPIKALGAIIATQVTSIIPSE